MQVPILKQGDCLIASIQAVLSDTDLHRLREELAEKVGRFRSKGVIIDVTSLDVIDSFATKTLQNIAAMTRLRGAMTLIVGIQPDVAFAMVQMGLNISGVLTALDLEEGLEILHQAVEKSLVGTEQRIPIHQEYDIVTARQVGRKLAEVIGFSGTDLTIIAMAISELARNIISYAKQGEIIFDQVSREGRHGISVIAQDRGPGIASIELAMRDGFSTGSSLGLGLPGAKRLMDEFEITSALGEGTTVTVKKWVP